MNPIWAKYLNPYLFQTQSAHRNTAYQRLLNKKIFKKHIYNRIGFNLFRKYTLGAVMHAWNMEVIFLTGNYCIAPPLAIISKHNPGMVSEWLVFIQLVRVCVLFVCLFSERIFNSPRPAVISTLLCLQKCDL